jgi:site-specific DNA-methyltransferase (adenine-specific)
MVNCFNLPIALKFTSAADADGSFHPTQKPVALLEYLTKTYTNEEMTVLDNTMGSGSTGVACINTNRKFIGIEKDDKYFKIAKERIQKLLRTVID